MTTVSKYDLDRIVDHAGIHSDMGNLKLQLLAESFVAAHALVPDGLSVEVGTRAGGSALLQLLLMGHMYCTTKRPLLFTIDPYGGKPYMKNNCKLYDLPVYGAAKMNLALFATHVHYMMTSQDYLKHVADLGYWWGGVARQVKRLAFVLLDGAHDADTVDMELQGFMPRVAPGGRILIDNVAMDPAVWPLLQKYGPTPLTKDHDLCVVVKP